ncbi:MAG: hypothetical protein IJC13_03700 [Clostridia bacterium]|nr:hypothetical protein [Clostridia bacterium]
MNKTLKKTLSVIITILMIVTSVPVSLAADDVNYIECSWDGTNNTVVSETKSVIEYTKITSDLTAWSTGWYVATGEVTIPSRVAVSGDVHLILCDDAVLTVNGGVRVEGKNSLTIYGQSDGTGKLIATATTDYYAGIGSNRNGGREPSAYGTIVIHGGTVEATGAWGGAAGIGGGTISGNGTILIYGGNITGTGTSNGAGIGSGGTSSQMTQNMGNVTILGGIVTGRTLWGAGIGSGRGNKSGGSLTVLGDNVQGYSDGGRGEGIGRGENAADIGKMVLSDGTPIISGAYTLPVSYTVDESNTLNVPAGTTLTIPAGVTLTNSGTITVQEGGTLINNGVIVQNGNFTNNGTFTCTHSVIADKWTTIEGTHYRECLSGCGGKVFEGACFGGVGTCLEGGICVDCGAVYLPKNPDNHVTEDTYIEYINDSNHGLYHSCCKALIQEIPHSPKEGQEATCVGVAVCADCGFAFGGNDTTNHTSEELKYVSNGKGTHILTHACCGNPAAAAEGHNMSYTVNGELTIEGICEDCGATGSVTLEPSVGGIYNGYAFKSTYSATGILSGLDAFEKPVISGCCEDGCADAGEHTVTMTMDDKSVSATFTVAPKELTITQLRASSKEYDGNSVVGVYGIDLEGIVVYKEGDYPDAMWDDVHDDVSLSYDNLLCTVDDVVPGTYETAKLSGVALKGNDAHNYVIAESLENVPLKDSNGYEYTIRNPIIHLEALDQFLVGDAELDQNEYIADGLREQFTMEGVLLYASGTSIEVDIDNVVIRFNGEDVTEYFDIWTYSGTLSRVCEGHEFDENGFCSTGQCNSYEPADKNVGTDEWGMEVEYYDIYNAGQLYWFAEQVNVYSNNGINGRLMDNITVNEDITAENLRQWTPIGGGYTPYTGFFDGQGYTVSGLYFNDPEATVVGLFGYTDYAYVIKDVHVSNSYFKADSHVGALIGSAGSIVSGCTADGTVTVEGETYRGGLIGYTSGGEVKNSWSAVAVPEGVGGLVGYNCATVTNCYTTASVLVGNNYYGGTTANCYYLSETETEDGGKTAEQFASGEVAYLLQNGVVAEEIYDDEGNYVESVTPHVWGQKIGSDDYPVLGGDKVYLVTNCNNENDYSNENINNTHDWSNKDGICANGCGTQCSHEGISDGECDICKAEFQASVTDKDGNEISTYKTFDEAFAVARENEDSTLTLLRSVTLTDYLFANSCRFTLDLNGKTLLKETDRVLQTGENADITIKDSGEGGAIQTTAEYATAIVNFGNLTIESGKIKSAMGISNDGTLNFIDGEVEVESLAAIYNGEMGVVYIYGGSLANNGENSPTIYNYGNLYVYGGEINGNIDILNDGSAYFSGGEFPNGLKLANNGKANDILALGYAFYDELGNRLDVADDATAIDGYVKVAESASKIFKVAYTPSADTHNTFTVKVDGRPTMIQFIEEDGGTRTYDRNNKNVTITSYDADGNEVSSLDRTAAYEVWTVYTNLIGPNVRMRAKYIEGTAYKWEKGTYDFTLEFAEPVYDTEIYESYLEPVTKKGPAKVVLVTGADVQGVRFKMPNGTTTTYYATGAKVLEDGKLEFTGKAWMNESGENIIEVYVRSQNTWTYYGYFTGTVE